MRDLRDGSEISTAVWQSSDEQAARQAYMYVSSTSGSIKKHDWSSYALVPYGLRS